MPGSFIDSNVLIYLASGPPPKAQKARDILDAGGTISVQVLNEVTNVCRRKIGLDWKLTHELLGTLRDLLVVVPLTTATHDLGLALARRYSVATYDAMIAGAALLADCDTLLTEDLQDGALLDGRLRIANPFRAA